MPPQHSSFFTACLIFIPRIFIKKIIGSKERLPNANPQMTAVSKSNIFDLNFICKTPQKIRMAFA
jgi:hypothetical protein